MHQPARGQVFLHGPGGPQRHAQPQHGGLAQRMQAVGGQAGLDAETFRFA